MDAFTKKLTMMFEQVETAFREATIARYKKNAQDAFDRWVKVLQGPKPESPRLIHDLARPPEYTRHARGSYMPQWEYVLRDINDGLFSVDLKQAEKDAIRSVEYAKTHFIGKQAKKLGNATKQRKDTPALEGTLSFNGIVVTGHLAAKYKNGDEFLVTLDMIVNHRYTRGYTSFYQFPCRFVSARLAGERVKARLSEKWLSENFK